LSIHDEHVARVFALELRDYLETIYGVGWQIFQGVHRTIDFVFRERDLELVGEETLCANLGEGLVQLLVAGGLEGHELRRDSATEQRALDEPSLAKSELGRPRPDSDDRGIGLGLRRH
jgi:hypothetical protein